MAHKCITVEKTDFGTTIISINRPDALNALNSETILELRKELELQAADDKVKCLILTGTGDKAFIAGADISEMANKTHSQGSDFSKQGHEVAGLLERMEKPTIAAVNGFALGGGTEMALACDFILSSDNALFGQPEVSLGIIPGFGGTFRLGRAVGFARAKELIFTGRKIKADEALRIGLVNAVFPQAVFRESVLKVAQEICRNSVGAVGACKKLLNEFQEPAGINFKIDSEVLDFGSLFGSPDQKEGMAAFLEKRKPKFL